MGDRSISVNESRDQNAIPVATNRVGDLHFPIYNMGYGPVGEEPTYVTPAAPLPVTNHLTEVNLGNVPGRSLIHKFGQNLLATTIEQDVWGYGGIMQFLEAAETMNVISTDTINDISVGNNARVVTLIGLDADFNEISEDVTLLATPVTTTKEFIRVYRMIVKEVGTYGATNLGKITSTATAAGTVQCDISIGDGQSGTTHYTVPAGFTAYIIRVSITVDSNQACDFHLIKREGADIILAPFTPYRSIHHWEGITQEGEKMLANHKLPEKTDVWLTCKMKQATGQVDVDYDILLVANQ